MSAINNRVQQYVVDLNEGDDEMKLRDILLSSIPEKGRYKLRSLIVEVEYDPTR